MKLCKDCKYGPKNIDTGMFRGFNTVICTHPNAPIDPVYGRKDASHSLMRSAGCLVENCGPNGDWFEEAAPKSELKPYEWNCTRESEETPKKKFWRIFG